MNSIIRLQNWSKLSIIFIPIFLIAVIALVGCAKPAPAPAPAPMPAPAPQPAPAPTPLPTLNAPQLIWPANGASNIATSPTLYWEATSDADTYILQISEYSDFSAIYLDTGYLYSDIGYFHGTKAGESSHYQVQHNLAAGTQYYWRVIAIANTDIRNSPRAYSEIWTFSTAKTLPAPAPILAPTPAPAPIPAPAPEQSLSRQPFGQPEQMKRYIIPDDPKIKATVQDILRQQLKVFTDFETLRDWVAWHVSYRFDQDVHGVSEYWQFPSETLELRTGDCEDFAILLCSLLRAYGATADQVYVAVGVSQDKTYHAYLMEKWYQGIWRVTEPLAGAWAGVFLADWATSVSYETLSCFNDQHYFEGPPTLPPGVYEFQLSFSGGTSATFERYMSSGQMITASVEWLGKCGNKPEPFTIFGWGLRIYDPNGGTVLSWFGGDLFRSFSFAVPTSGKYKVQVYIGGVLPTSARLTIDPPDWSKQ